MGRLPWCSRIINCFLIFAFPHVIILFSLKLHITGLLHQAEASGASEGRTQAAPASCRTWDGSLLLGGEAPPLTFSYPRSRTKTVLYRIEGPTRGNTGRKMREAKVIWKEEAEEKGTREIGPCIQCLPFLASLPAPSNSYRCYFPRDICMKRNSHALCSVLHLLVDVLINSEKMISKPRKTQRP